MNLVPTNTLVRAFSWFFAAAFVCLIISGCGSSKEDTSAPVTFNDSLPLGTLVAGEFDRESSPFVLHFTVVEDNVLNGLFAEPEKSTGSRFAIKTLPEHGELTLRTDDSVFHYTPVAEYSGNDGFVYETSDGSVISVSISVISAPDAPVFDRNIPRAADQNSYFSTVLQASDADGDPLKYSATNLPDWLELDPDTGLLSGTPQQSDIGMTQKFVLMVSDGTGLNDVINDFQLNVIDINDPPILNVSQVPRKLYGGEEFTFNVFPDDRDNDTVSVSVEPHPAFESTVENGIVTLRMHDINLARASELTIVGRDNRGAINRESLPVNLYPRTASGKGTTVLGVKEGRGVHISILGDGYAADQRVAFERHVDGVLDYIRADDGIADHLGAFNVHMIYTVSEQSGVDDNDLDDSVDSAFGSTYNCQSIPRLVCADTEKLYVAALAEYPSTDQFILLVNDIRFGGSGSSGGRVAITSAFHPEIALHEMGHSLANLADEYVDPLILDTSSAFLFDEGEFANVSRLADPLKVPWSHWIDPSVVLPQKPTDGGVGVFEGGHYRSRGVYRATYNSRMREYDKPFGPVNTEQWVLRLYTLTDGYRALEPTAGSLTADAGEVLEFSVEPIFGPLVQETVWTLNEEVLTTIDGRVPLPVDGISTDLVDNSNEGLPQVISLQGGGAIDATSNVNFSSVSLVLPPGRHQLKLTLSDISGRIRVSPPHVGIFEKIWEIVVQ